ncbi:MDR family MFS transporter [Tessaracoccus antarcticus]|uniref:DHA2 family efflux MFS transporter permease subunit n=1 Tax=Tessaracoccus antarcticus TaxID=2479848 RepID=A0A3M0G581_9ACTN|nr:MDR family MFS transporter [Tessaracoccus antarcticus]RMB60191.1 DHA2 family efflux MFS transporter permease subunit [Tessaracoccus antarcticus]
MTTTASATSRSAPLTRSQFRWTFTGLLLAMLLAALDQTIVATALPTIVGELNGLEHLSWVVTAYLLAATIGLPIYGKTGDVIGRKPVFIFAIVVFLIGSILSGIAQDMTQLIAFRALQGLGGGGLMIGAQAILGDIVSPRERGKYMGLIGAVFGLSSVGGPLIGGFLTDYLTWRWVFYVNMPLGLVALATVIFALHANRPTGQRKPIDLLGMVLLGATSTAIVLTTSWGGTTYEWGDPVIVGLIIGAVLGMALFIFVDTRASDPVIPLSLFRDRNFVLPSAVGLTIGISLFVAVAYMPTFLQMVNGVTATQSGLMLIPMTVGLLFAAIISGRLISATGRYKIYPIIGTALVAVGLIMLSRIDQNTPYWYLASSLVVLGLGVGAAMQNLTLIVQNSVPGEVMGTATSAQNYVRQIGASVGIAVFGSVFISRLTSEMSGTPIGGAQGGNISSLTPEILAGLPEAVQRTIAGAFSTAMPPLFLYAVPVALAGLALALFIEERPLSAHPTAGRMSGSGVADAAPVMDGVAEPLFDGALASVEGGSVSPRRAASGAAPEHDGRVPMHARS